MRDTDGMTYEVPGWTTELESALLGELHREFMRVNHGRFGGRLLPPALRLTNAAVLGRWIPGERVIELSRQMVLERPWGEAMEVFKHEVAHQFVDEVLGIRDESPHGPTFQRVCRERGIDARSSGRPRPGETGDESTARLVDKVRRLLALASSQNQHEAELAMQRARELMLKHALEVDGAGRSYVFRYLGRPQQRKSRAEKLVGALLAEFFFVKVIWTYAYAPYKKRWERILEVSGTPENVEMAEYVHAFLLEAAGRLWDEARARHPGIGRGDRVAFMAGVINGFRDKLRRAEPSETGAGLVWLGDPDLQAFFSSRHPRTRKESRANTWRPAESVGREAGHKLVLHRPLERGSTGAVRLLPK